MVESTMKITATSNRGGEICELFKRKLMGLESVPLCLKINTDISE